MKAKSLKSFKELIVWQKAYKLVLEIYKVTKDFPKSETYGLTQQMRRAAISIPSNIAEGYGRKHKTEYHRFLSIAYGSLSELETQYLLSIDLGYIKRGAAIEALLTQTDRFCPVIPAKAGIQERIDTMDSRFRGNDKLRYVLVKATLTATTVSKPVSLSY